MKNITRFCIVTLVLSMLLAFVVFTLFAGGILVLDTSSRIFELLIVFACILLSALLLGSLSALLPGPQAEGRSMLRSLSCCITISAAGGGCLALAAFLTSLSAVFSGIAFSIGIALCFFFLSLLVGGIFCLLHGLFTREQEGRNTDDVSAGYMTGRDARSRISRSGIDRSGISHPGPGYSAPRPSFRQGYEEREVPEDGYFGRRPPL